MKGYLISLVSGFIFYPFLSFTQMPVQTKVIMDQKDSIAHTLLNDFMTALLIEDFNESAQAVLPLVHQSLQNKTHTALTRDLMDFSFKKAHSNAKFYQVPVEITEVRATNVTGIGFKETAQLGEERKYWIAKKAGINGMPAPINIFFPADGSQPKINYMGSL